MTTRRRFLVATAGTVPLLGTSHDAGTLTAVEQPAGRTPPRKELKLGTVTYNIAKDWDVPTLIANLTEAGIGAVELRTTHKHGVEPALAAAERAEVRKRFADSPIRIGGLGTTCEYHASDPAVLRKNIDETRAWIALANDLGCPSVKVRPNGLRPDVPEEQSLEQIGKSLAECGRAAQDQGVRIQVEVHGRETARLPRIRRILEHAGNHPHVWVCWNSNQEDLLDGGLDANFALVKDRIGQVHMRDLYIEEYPWQRLVQLLQGINFEGYCFAELGQPSTDGVRVLKYFRGMFRLLQGIVDPPRKV
jgi:sugar phosphate isomerase/epimerase